MDVPSLCTGKSVMAPAEKNTVTKKLSFEVAARKQVKRILQRKNKQENLKKC